MHPSQELQETAEMAMVRTVEVAVPVQIDRVLSIRRQDQVTSQLTPLTSLTSEVEVVEVFSQQFFKSECSGRLLFLQFQTSGCSSLL